MAESFQGIKGFLETSFVDWPGRIAAVLFLGGCNYRCPYCHNRRIVLEPETLPDWPLDEILRRLGGRRNWVDGVCVTGGEPTVHPGLPGLLKILKADGWAVKLDTNGSRPQVLGGILQEGTVDAISMDIKAPLDDVSYRRNGGPGADPQKVAQSLALVAGSGIPLETRTTVHPDLLKKSDLKLISDQLKKALGKGHRNKFQNFAPGETLDPALSPFSLPTREEFEKMLAEIGVS